MPIPSAKENTHPIAWESTILGRVITIKTGPFGSALHRSDYIEDGIPLINPSHIVNGNIVPSSTETVTPETVQRLSNYILNEGDIVLGRRGEMGRCAVVKPEQAGWMCGSGSFILRPSTDVSTEFLQRTISSPENVRRLTESSIGSTMNNLNHGALEALPLTLPPRIEQDKIAKVLRDVDLLVEFLELMIAKERNIKLAAMQQLMDGARRLPGWSQGWSEVEVGQLCSPRKNRIYPGIPSAAQFCVELEHIEGKTGQLIGATTAGAGLSMKTEFHSGDVLFGKLRAYLQKFWLADRSGACSTEIWALAPQSDLIDSRYLRQLVSTHRFIQAASTAYGTHMPRSEWNTVARLRIQTPTIPEQEAIAEILSGMDSDIAVLVSRRNKLTLVKQAMTQELLSGRTRLP